MTHWVFVDTGAFVGLFLEKDEWHPQAKSAFETLGSRRKRLLTTSDVFNETVTSIRKWGGYESALQAGEILKASKLANLISIDEPLREAAWALFKGHRIPGLSFTDCTSFAVMEKYGISEAFTFDDDFRKAGYTVLPGKRK